MATVSLRGSSNSNPDIGTPYSPKAASFESTSKEILRVFWTYGEDQIPVSQQSRFYSDFNIHLETRNYNAGETVEITIEDEDASDGLSQIALNAIVQADGSATIFNALSSRRVEILAKG